MKRKDYTDPMSMFNSPSRNRGKIIQEGEKVRNNDEELEQIKFCKWMNLNHEDIRYRSDIQSSANTPKWMLDRKKIIDPFKSWPDIQIYLKRGKYCGLQIEMKRLGSGLYLKDGSLSNVKHVQEQNECHAYLRECGWDVSFAEGFEKAKELFESYLKI